MNIHPQCSLKLQTFGRRAYHVCTQSEHVFLSRVYIKIVKGEKWVLTVLSFEYHFMTLSKKFESKIAKEVLADQY